MPLRLDYWYFPDDDLVNRGSWSKSRFACASPRPWDYHSSELLSSKRPPDNSTPARFEYAVLSFHALSRKRCCAVPPFQFLYERSRRPPTYPFPACCPSA